MIIIWWKKTSYLFQHGFLFVLTAVFIDLDLLKVVAKKIFPPNGGLMVTYHDRIRTKLPSTNTSRPSLQKSNHGKHCLCDWVMWVQTIDGHGSAVSDRWDLVPCWREWQGHVESTWNWMAGVLTCCKLPSCMSVCVWYVHRLFMYLNKRNPLNSMNTEYPVSQRPCNE